jgi:hypothetical protein
MRRPTRYDALEVMQAPVGPIVIWLIDPIIRSNFCAVVKRKVHTMHLHALIPWEWLVPSAQIGSGLRGLQGQSLLLDEINLHWATSRVVAQRLQK